MVLKNALEPIIHISPQAGAGCSAGLYSPARADLKVGATSFFSGLLN